MIRKTLAAFVALTAMLFGVLALQAPDADACSYWQAIRPYPPNCADQIEYAGGFTNMPPAPTGPYGWGAANAAVAAAADAGAGADAGATGGTGGGLATTGSESAVVAYVGTGLVAFGAVALGSRRKFFQGALD